MNTFNQEISDVEAQAEVLQGNHRDHLYVPGDKPHYDELIERLEEWLEANSANLPPAFLELRIPEMATVVNQLRLADAAEVIRRLPIETAIALCDFPDLSRRALICKQLAPELAAAILEGLSSDELIYILRGMSEHERYRLLPLVSDQVRKEVDLLLSYKDETAGSIMTTEFVSLQSEMKVQQALEHIRQVAADRETIYACYVLEPETGHLLGAVSLRDLVIADPSRSVSAVMRRHPVVVHVGDRKEEVADKVSRYNLLAIPVLEQA